MVEANQNSVGALTNFPGVPGRGEGYAQPRSMQTVVRELMVAAGIQDIRRPFALRGIRWAPISGGVGRYPGHPGRAPPR